MAEPRRVRPMLLAWNKSVIYFATARVKSRSQVLANTKVFGAIARTIDQLSRWKVAAGVVMPEHPHLLVAPRYDRDLSVGDFAAGFKRVLRRDLGEQQWEWQRGRFERLLRSDESLVNKWVYVAENPVRAGLVERSEDWPYRFDFVNGKEDGKLTAYAPASPPIMKPARLVAAERHGSPTVAQVAGTRSP